MLCWIAMAASHLRIATRVLGFPYRPRAIVARTAETLDRLSGGGSFSDWAAAAADDAR